MDAKTKVKGEIALIGSGATAIYLLKHLSDKLKVSKNNIKSISIFERAEIMGTGMPYSPQTTDIYNLSNISSQEIPELPESFGDWLRKQDRNVLKTLNVVNFPIDDSAVYSRLSLGQYFKAQYKLLLREFSSLDIIVKEYANTSIVDVFFKSKDHVSLLDDSGNKYYVEYALIATGHEWENKDLPKLGYFSSPWPIQKILPKKGKFYNHTIGVLGASLSAFDVVTSLAHRHGKFLKRGENLTFVLNAKSLKFKIIMHSLNGWLPHLQYEQKNAMREIYRHTNKDQILSLVDKTGFLSLEDYYDVICRPALKIALTRDGLGELAIKIVTPNFRFKDFVKTMSDQHEYINSFQGMRDEMETAKKYLDMNRPDHWKETLDDLMYCLNFHAELMSAEDHFFFHQDVMPFLMNVIAALPLSSAKIILALYDSGCIDLVEGNVKVQQTSPSSKITTIEVEDQNGSIDNFQYSMYIECAGQKSLDLNDFPFPNLVSSNLVRSARAKFRCLETSEIIGDVVGEEKVFTIDDISYLNTGGIDVDASYRIIGKNGRPNNKIYDISFSHTTGFRPYSYGLQACSATSKIMVEAWMKLISEKSNSKVGIDDMTELYENL